MKTSAMRLLGFMLCIVTTITFTSCKKKSSTTPATSPHTVTMQPGTDGQDTYVSKIDNNASDGGANLNFANELVLGRWTAAGGAGLATQRGYLKFTGLSAIPTSANVTSAKLYLYGKPSSITYPSGNSTYPGSSNQDNSSIIQRVTGSDWNQGTINWNNMPIATDVGQAAIPPSTSQFSYNVVVDVTTIVKEMVVHPTTNYGFLMKLANETQYRSLIFATSESADITLRPKLVVDATY